MKIKFRSPWLVGLLVCAIVIPLAFEVLFRTEVRQFYPWLKVSAGDSLEIESLVVPQSDATQCAAQAAMMASAIESSCRACSVIAHECLTSLDEDRQRYLTAAPLPLPTVHSSRGVAVFSSVDPAIALAACRESERHGRKGEVTCYPAGAVRPALKNVADMASPSRWVPLSPVIWVLLGGLLIAVIGAPLFNRWTSRLSASLAFWSRPRKQQLILLVDLLSIEFALWGAYVLRFDFLGIPPHRSLPLFLIAPLIGIPVFASMGLYRSIIRYLGLHGLLAVAKAVAVYAVLLAVVHHLLALPEVPRSVHVIQSVLALMLVGFSRTMARFWITSARFARQSPSSWRNVIIYGAGEAGAQLASALAHSSEYRPVALVDQKTSLHGKRVGALEVFPPERLPTLIEELDVHDVLLVIPSASRSRRSEIVAMLEPLPVHVRILPNLSELAGGQIQVQSLREVEIEDLLGRDAVAPGTGLLAANIAGRSVMVTGAGGSIGSELCRQILEQGPTRLVLFELSEFALYSIEQELIGRLGGYRDEPGRARPEILPLLGSVTDQARLERIIQTFGVQTIFHAAAYKHVPMVERNPCEGVYNNVIGTYRTALAARRQKVETFVLISTDKAVRPTNTMGTSKRVAEMILQAFAASQEQGPCFSIVRFGNVLGSSGSVVPLFREQIRKGGPVTVTDPRIIRYFMTIPEAAQLVIQAGAMGKDGEVFVLDMGEPVKIVDLARRMIHLSGLEVKDEEHPDGDIAIEFSGLRPGEKLYEELLIGDDVRPTEHPRIMRANEKRISLEEIERLLAELLRAIEKGDSAGIRNLLLEAVDEFKPQCGVEDVIYRSAGPAAAAARSA